MPQKVSSPNKLFFSYLHAKKSAFYLPALSSIINKIFDLMPPILVAWVIDSIAHKPPIWLVKLFPVVASNPWYAVIYLTILTVLIFAGESIFQWGYEYGFQRLAQTTQNQLRNDVYKQLQKKKLSFFENNRTGNLMTFVNDDVNQLERFLNDGFNQILQIVTLFIFAGITLFYTEAFLASLSLVTIPFIFWGSIYYQKKISPHYQKIRKTVGDLGSRLENNISGISVIKSFTAEAKEEQRVQEASEEYLNANLKAIKISSLYVPLIRMFIALGFAAVILIGGYQIIHGTTSLTVGEFTLFAMMIQRMLWPVTRFGVIFNDYERAMASVKRIFDLIHTEKDKEMHSNKDFTPTEHKKWDIELKNISFGYTPQKTIIQNLNLTIAAQSRVGIVGATGAGKTTLIKLLLRLYDIDEGKIYISGEDIVELSHQKIREKIGLVSQDVYLFHGTILENLQYGGNHNLNEIIEFCKMVGMHEFIMSLPEEYESIVGERGVKLSGGQRQRLSIVRALLKKSPILLFDEATSAVDVETEGYIQQHLEEITQNTTTVLIAHRLSTVRNCDKIIVMDKGEIVEEGKHEALLNLNGVYAKLWQIQTGNYTQNF